MARLSIDKNLKDHARELVLGCVEVTGAVIGETPKSLWKLINKAAQQAVTGLTAEALYSLPEIIALREVYHCLGKEPARYRGSAEALLRRMIQGKGLYKVNVVVDINNHISIQTRHSVGVYDLDQLQGQLVFRVGQPGETYKGIGKDIINIAELPVFADELGPYGSPTSDSERAMITTKTTHLLLVIIDFIGNRDRLTAALSEAAKLLTEYASATVVDQWLVE